MQPEMRTGVNNFPAIALLIFTIYVSLIKFGTGIRISVIISALTQAGQLMQIGFDTKDTELRLPSAAERQYLAKGLQLLNKGYSENTGARIR
jgi:hypothetical protein